MAKFQLRRRGSLLLLLALSLFLAGCGAQTGGGDSLSISLNMPESGESMSNSLQVLLLLSALAFLPTVVILMTGFVRIAVVLASLRMALGVPMLPPNQVIIGLALILSFFVMAPTFEEINDRAFQPYVNGEMDVAQALDASMDPMREFMFSQVGQDDLALFVYLSGSERPETRADIPTYALLPAFVVSELKVAFQMVFIIYIPFLVIDIVIASALMSMGMMMLPPTIISLPFKLLLFVMVDGWNLLIRNLVISFFV